MGNINWGIMLECVVHYLVIYVVIVTQVDFLWFFTTNLFVAFIPNCLANQNIVRRVGSDLALDFCDKTAAWLSKWNMNLN